ncbi:DUF4270 domain-containing protein [Bacteroides sp.]|uniref:DUF4270 domain-containing protein n=1 Tax=Bacteroides sp. TaxID=29523 RepID=UPI0026359763|nr:DUF4270 domain-containing protein [Bacteroides sp.]MDD3036819.1 DUF4270 domain-containing protein [Bacteroides sp.]
MKAKYALIALLAITFFGCDDNTAGLGLGMFPGSDQNISGRLTTFDVTTSSVPTGQIYAKTNIGYVGKFTDETFGTYQAGFLASINCPEKLTFPGVYKNNALNADGKVANNMVIEPADDIKLIYDNDQNEPIGEPIGNIHTVELYLWYKSYFGDSLTACRLSVYELDEKLELKDKPYYTNIDPNNYYNEADLLGSKTYTAVDLSIKDSIRKSDSYTPNVNFSFKDDISYKVGGKILRAARRAGTSFDYNKFSDIFKGIYIKSDYGDGTILYISQAQMRVVYKCYEVDKKTGIKLKKSGSTADSTYYTTRDFVSTREVIQANQLANDKEKIKELIEEDNNTYIKSPAGIFTQAILPINEINEKLQLDTLNAVKLTFSNYNQSSENKFGMTYPSTLMLIRKKFKDSFFENNQLTDNITSYLTSHSTNINQYVFSNITNLVNDCVADGEREAAEKKFLKGETITLQFTNAEGETETKIVDNIIDWEKYSDWNKVLLIPVLITYDDPTSQNRQIISVQHDLKPGYVRLKGGSRATDPNYSKEEQDKFKLKLEVVSTNFGN